MDKTMKKPIFISPKVLEHHKISFETMISGSDSVLPSPDYHQREPGSVNPTSPASIHPTLPSTDQSPLPRVNQQAIPKVSQSPLPIVGEQPKIPTVAQSPNPTAKQSNTPATENLTFSSSNQDFPATLTNITTQSTKEELASDLLYEVNSQPLDSRSAHVYSLPNTGTTWYTLGIEGLIIAGLSGLALWYRKGAKRKNEMVD